MQQVSLGGGVNQAAIKTKFKDLNEDVQLDILESLDLKDLLSVAQTNRYFALLAEYIFKRKHSHKIIKIFDSNANIGDDTLDGGDIIQIQSVRNILAFLRHFGRSILHLEIVYNSNATELADSRLINERISLHCTESLVKIGIETYNRSFFDRMTRPFKHVEDVTIRGLWKTSNNSVIHFNEWFPAMHRLHLSIVQIPNRDCINQTFSNLEHLTVEALDFKGSTSFSDTDLIMIVKKNPQIRSLKLGRYSRQLLVNINDLLPNLENLELIHYILNNDPESTSAINFEHLKTLTIYPGYNSISNNFRFGNLVELHTDTYPSVKNWWTDLLRDNQNLTGLYLNRGCANDKTLKEILSAKLKLIEISLTICRDDSYGHVIDFVQRSEQIKKFHFLKYYPDVSLKLLAQVLMGAFPKDCKITRTNQKVYLERE